MNEREQHVMEHATAWRSTSRLYRNHYVAGPDHKDWPTLRSLCERGLMRVRIGPSELSGGMTVFTVTPDGVAALEFMEST